MNKNNLQNIIINVTYLVFGGKKKEQLSKDERINYTIAPLAAFGCILTYCGFSYGLIGLGYGLTIILGLVVLANVFQ